MKKLRKWGKEKFKGIKEDLKFTAKIIKQDVLMRGYLFRKILKEARKGDTEKLNKLMDLLEDDEREKIIKKLYDYMRKRIDQSEEEDIKEIIKKVKVAKIILDHLRNHLRCQNITRHILFPLDISIPDEKIEKEIIKSVKKGEVSRLLLLEILNGVMIIRTENKLNLMKLAAKFNQPKSIAFLIGGFGANPFTSHKYAKNKELKQFLKEYEKQKIKKFYKDEEMQNILNKLIIEERELNKEEVDYLIDSFGRIDELNDRIIKKVLKKEIIKGLVKKNKKITSERPAPMSMDAFISSNPTPTELIRALKEGEISLSKERIEQLFYYAYKKENWNIVKLIIDHRKEFSMDFNKEVYIDGERKKKLINAIIEKIEKNEYFGVRGLLILRINPFLEETKNRKSYNDEEREYLKLWEKLVKEEAKKAIEIMSEHGLIEESGNHGNEPAVMTLAMYHSERCEGLIELLKEI